MVGPRLVEQEHIGVLEDGARNGDALLLRHSERKLDTWHTPAAPCDNMRLLQGRLRTWPPLVWIPCSRQAGLLQYLTRIRDLSKLSCVRTFSPTSVSYLHVNTFQKNCEAQQMLQLNKGQRTSGAAS